MELGIHVREHEEGGLFRIDSNELRELYELVDEIRSEELRFANSVRPLRPRQCLTKMRTRLSKVSKLCKAVRQDLLDTRAAHEVAAKEYWKKRRPEIAREKAEREARRADREASSSRYHGSW